MGNGNSNFLPMFEVGMDEFSDGVIIKMPSYCKERYFKKNSQKCRCYYNTLFNKDTGIYTCPYGFNSFVSKKEDNIDIFTCFRVKDKYNVSKVNNKIQKEDENRVITYNEMKNYIKVYNREMELSKKYDQLNKFIQEMVHDIRKFNTTIKTKSEIISNKSSGKKKFNGIGECSLSVQVMSEFISSRLDIYNYLYSKQSLKNGEKFEFNFYTYFYKIKKCLSERAFKKKIKIKLDSNKECSSIYAYDSIELIPFLVLDNAIKYTTNGEDINIYIYDNISIQEVIIEAYGAKIEEEELDKIFEREYRGKNAKEFCNDGSGIGLYLVKRICETNGLKIEVESKDIQQNVNKNEALFRMVISYTK